MFKRIVFGAASAALVIVASSAPAHATISNASCSSGQAKSSGCNGGNEAGGDPKKDAACCWQKARAAGPRGPSPLALPTTQPAPRATATAAVNKE